METKRKVVILGIIAFFYAHVYGVAQAPVAWREALGARVLGIPASQAESVVVVCDDGTLRAFGKSGTALWRYDSDTKLLPFLSRSREGTSYIGRTDGALVAVNRSGRELWRRNLGGTLIADVDIGWDGRVFATTGTSLICYTAAGTCLWKRTLPTRPSCDPALVSDGGLFLSLLDAELFHVSPFGEVHAIPIPVAASSLASSFGASELGLAIAALGDGTIRAYTKNAEKRTVISLGKKALAVKSRGEEIAFILEEGTVGLIDALSGAKLWTGLGPLSQDARLIVDDRGIYALSKGGAVGFTFDGRRLWTLKIDGADTPPTLSDEGMLYSGGTDWILYAYRVEERVRANTSTLYGPSSAGNYGLGSPPSNFAEDPFALEENTIDARLSDIQKAIDAEAVGDKEKDFTAYLMGIAGSERAKGGGSERLRHPTVLAHRRVRAALLLGRFGSREVVPFLVDVFSRDGEPLVQAAAAEAIGMIGVDPEGKALKAFARALFPPYQTRDERTLVAIAEATGALCRFSGPPLSDEGIRLLVLLSADENAPIVRSRARAELDRLRIQG